MADVSYKKRWTIPFMSLGGVSCRVDIYKKGYTGTDVTEISVSNANTPGYPATNPFYFEEDDDEDLLVPVRTKTGYINLIEDSYGSLDDLLPQTNTDHYVKFYYGSTLTFTGYIKAQMFENDFGAFRREISLPVTSPLGLADGLFFDAADNPSFRTLGSYMQTVMVGLAPNVDGDNGINEVVIPDPTPSAQKSLFAMYISSLVMNPRDIETVYQDTPITHAADMFGRNSFYYFLEGLCNAFGMRLYDEPGRMVFVSNDRYDHYARLTKANVATGETRTTVDPVNNSDMSGMSLAGNENTESMIMPKAKIDVSCDGQYFSEVGLPYYACRREYNGGTYEGKSYAMLFPLNNELTADSLHTTTAAGAINSDTGRLNSAGVSLMYGDGAGEMVLFQQGSGFNSGRKTVVKAKYCDGPHGFFRISFACKIGDTVANLDEATTLGPLGLQIRIYIKCGDYYFNGGSWTTGVSCIETYFAETQQVTIISGPSNDQQQPLEVWVDVVDASALLEERLYCISDFSISDLRTPFVNYVYSGRQSAKTLYGVPSNENANVDMAFSYLWGTSNFIGYRNTAGGTSTPLSPSYDYILEYSQNRLQLHMKGTVPDVAYGARYFNRYRYAYKTGWRMIGCGFYPWDDEYLITLQRLNS